MKPKLYLLAVGLCACLFAASPTIINRNGQWPPQGNSFGFGGPMEIRYQAIPLTLTDVAAKDARIISVTVFNNTAGALTLTLQTKDASPLPLPLNGSIPANASVSFNIPTGLLSTGGFSVQSSGAGLYYSAVWTN